jgi:hypothetical protein
MSITYNDMNFSTDSFNINNSQISNEQKSNCKNGSFLLNSSYSLWKTEPNPNFNSCSFFWSSKFNGYNKIIKILLTYYKENIIFKDPEKIAIRAYRNVNSSKLKSPSQSNFDFKSTTYVSSKKSNKFEINSQSSFWFTGMYTYFFFI